MKFRSSTLEFQKKLNLNFDNLELLQTAITQQFLC